MSLILEYGSRFDPPGAAVLGVIGYAADRPDALDPGLPFARVEMPGPAYEVWASRRPVTCRRLDGIALADDGEVAFGVLQMGQGGSLHDQAGDAYRRLLGLIDHLPQRHLLRVWNHMPAITAEEDGQERYRAFNAGRQSALRALRPDLHPPPAASALGSSGGALVVAFLAAREPGLLIENPRQVSAYHYPPLYGPSSPAFSRSVLHPLGFLVSGTASILGHASVHPGDVAAQTRETVANLRALLAEAAERGFRPRDSELCLKVYVRHAADMAAVRAVIAQDFPAAVPLILQAEICRPELLVEAELAVLRDGVTPAGTAG